MELALAGSGCRGKCGFPLAPALWWFRHEGGRNARREACQSEELHEVHSIGETIGIDVAKNKHGDNFSDLSAVKRRNRQNGTKELSSLDF